MNDTPWRCAGPDRSRRFLEFLDAGEDVVPATVVEAGGVVAQITQDFFHLEGGESFIWRVAMLEFG